MIGALIFVCLNGEKKLMTRLLNPSFFKKPSDSQLFFININYRLGASNVAAREGLALAHFSFISYISGG